MGETQVIWNWCGEVTGFYVDLCFRDTEEAKPNPSKAQFLHPGAWSTHTNNLGGRWLEPGPKQSAIIPGPAGCST